MNSNKTRSKLNLVTIILVIALSVAVNSCNSQEKQKSQKTTYAFKSGDTNGIGKWYMGREIAHVMGFQGMSWLERREREAEENTSILIKNMNIQPSDTIADIGAGSGYHAFKMAAMAKKGHIYAVDIQDEMLEAIEQKKEEKSISNIATIKGDTKNVNLPENSMDKVLMVDVYHEFDFPAEMIASIKRALRADGKIYLIEYRGEDATIPIKKIHKMTEKQSVKEIQAAGFILEENIDNLPWQHCMVFIKP